MDEEEIKSKTEIIQKIFEQYNPEDIFSKEDYEHLISHYRDENLNQFYYYIIDKVLEKKEFTENSDSIRTSLTAILADKVRKTSIPAESDFQIMNFANTVYKILMIIDIQEFYDQNQF